MGNKEINENEVDEQEHTNNVSLVKGNDDFQSKQMNSMEMAHLDSACSTGTVRLCSSSSQSQLIPRVSCQEVLSHVCETTSSALLCEAESATAANTSSTPTSKEGMLELFQCIDITQLHLKDSVRLLPIL